MNNLLKDVLEPLESVLCDPEGKAGIWGSDADNAIIDAALNALRAALAEPQPELAEFVLVPREPTPEMVGAMAVEESTGTINGISTLGMAGACLAWESALAAAPKAQQPRPEPVAGKTPHFTIMWTICRFALAYPTEVLLHQIGRFSEVLEGNEQQSIRSLLIRAQNQKPQVPCTPLVPSAAPLAQRPPLTHEQIDAIWSAQGRMWRMTPGVRLSFARAIEAAHGIGVKS